MRDPLPISYRQVPSMRLLAAGSRSLMHHLRELAQSTNHRMYTREVTDRRRMRQGFRVIERASVEAFA